MKVQQIAFIIIAVHVHVLFASSPLQTRVVNAITAAIKEHSIPTFSISDLQRLSDDGPTYFSRSDEFGEALSTTGLIAIRFDDDNNDSNYNDNINNNNNDREKGNKKYPSSSSSSSSPDDDNLGWYYSHDRRVAFDGLCSCIDHPEFLSNIDQTHELILFNTMTQRTSVATATVGLDHPLPLPSGLEETCGRDVAIAMEGLRDFVATVSVSFVSAVDKYILDESATSSSITTTLLRDGQRGKSYKSISDIVSSANHLEHFHVYTNKKETQGEGTASRHNNNNKNSDVAWDWHTDAGLFLVFVPAWDCNSNDNSNNVDESFYYRDGNDGTPTRAKFDGSRTAIVMLGQGAQDWLNLPVSSKSRSKKRRKGPLLKATSHSVRWADDNNNNESTSSFLIKNKQAQVQPQRRAWYGMMHLVPETALIYGGKTLREVKQTLSLSHQKKKNYQPSNDASGSLSLGCGEVLTSSLSHQHGNNNDDDDDDDEDYFEERPSSISRRRLMDSQDPSMCNNVTNFFCWMTCMDVPKPDQADLYVDAGYSLYCLDESVISKGGNASAAYEQCIDRHNMGCKGFWEKTVDGVPAATINISANVSDIDYPFCYGGTTMYMEGFQWIQSSTCVILLFPSWKLNTGWKYALGVIGTFLFAIGLEKFIQQRRKVMAYMEAGKNRLWVSALFYGVQLSYGYILMLIIMIYSFVLFLAVILGLVTGHILFNSIDAIWPIHNDEISTAFENNSDDVDDNNDDVSNLNKEERNPSFLASSLSSAATKVEMNLLVEAPEERALDEGSTHCQEFDNHEYYGSMDIKEKNAHDEKMATAASAKKKKEQNKNTKKEVDRGIPEGSTPCCQHGI